MRVIAAISIFWATTWHLSSGTVSSAETISGGENNHLHLVAPIFSLALCEILNHFGKSAIFTWCWRPGIRAWVIGTSWSQI